MRLSWSKRPRKQNNLVPLINIVFLILIFFLIASTIRPFSNRQINLAETQAPMRSAVSARVLIINSDGIRTVDGLAMADDDMQARFAAWSKETKLTLTVVADRTVPANQLIAVVALANAAGIENVKLLTRHVR